MVRDIEDLSKLRLESMLVPVGNSVLLHLWLKLINRGLDGALGRRIHNTLRNSSVYQRSSTIQEHFLHEWLSSCNAAATAHLL